MSKCFWKHDYSNWNEPYETTEICPKKSLYEVSVSKFRIRQDRVCKVCNIVNSRVVRNGTMPKPPIRNVKN